MNQYRLQSAALLMYQYSGLGCLGISKVRRWIAFAELREVHGLFTRVLITNQGCHVFEEKVVSCTDCKVSNLVAGICVSAVLLFNVVPVAVVPLQTLIVFL